MAAMNLILRSERLQLRPVDEDDLDVGIEILTDPAGMKHVGMTYTRNQVIEELPFALRRCAGGCIGIWCVIDRSTEEKLGTVSLLSLPVEDEDTNWGFVVGEELPDCEIEIGFLLKRSAWGAGYATEACKRLLKFGLEETELKAVVAEMDAEIAASQNVHRKCGLIDEGMGRAYAAVSLGR